MYLRGCSILLLSGGGSRLLRSPGVLLALKGRVGEKMTSGASVTILAHPPLQLKVLV